MKKMRRDVFWLLISQLVLIVILVIALWSVGSSFSDYVKTNRDIGCDNNVKLAVIGDTQPHPECGD